MENSGKELDGLRKLGMPEEMLTLYRHFCDTNDEAGRERLLRRFCEIKKQSLAEARRELCCLDYLMARMESAGEKKKSEGGGDPK